MNFTVGDIVRCVKSNVVDKDHYSIEGHLYRITDILDTFFKSKQAISISNGSVCCDSSRFELAEDVSELVREVL